MAYSLRKILVRSALGEAAVQGHLAAFKAAHHAVAGDGLGALGAAARVLAPAAAHTLTDALLFLLLARRWFEIAEIHLVYSSTILSKCGTLATIPRNPGVSGFTTLHD